MQNTLSRTTALFQPNLSPNVRLHLAWTILRVVVGIVMIHNGLDKLADIENFAKAYVEVIGLPFPIFFAYCAAFAELIGAPLLALGILARPAALSLLATMSVAMYHHVSVAGFNIAYLELSLLYAACFLFFAVNGAGQYSLDAAISGWLRDRLQRQQTEQRNTLEKSYQTESQV